MPKPSRQSVKAYPSDRIQDYWIKEELYERTLSEYEVQAKLRKFGLDPYEAELIILRYIEEKSMQDIVKEQGWLNISSASHYLRRTLSKLREGKFTLR